MSTDGAPHTQPDCRTVHIQAVNIDWYSETADVAEALAHPHAHPVIRIFGPLRDGTRTCAHVHGVFPYLYFRPENMEDPMFSSRDQLEAYGDIMERAIEAAVADLKKKANSDWRGGRVVRGVTVVERLPMYGFYASPFPFARVSLWRPQDVSIVATALQAGILGRVMQPYEAHVPYLLQFAMDYNIPGMGILTASNIMVRQPANGDVATAPAQDIAASTALLDDITYSQLMWSQDPYRQQGSPPGARERPAADVDPIAGTRLSYEVVDKYTRWFRQSLLSTTSTVELEIDVHESFIVVGESASPDSNQQAPAVSGERCPTASSGDETVVPVFSHVHSLGEIWREEVHRRRQRGLPQDATESPAYTNTVHREIGPFEREFAIRRGRLEQKVQRVARSRVEDGELIEDTDGACQLMMSADDMLLTQAVITGDISAFVCSTSRHAGLASYGADEPADAADNDEECWASQIQDAAEEANDILSSCTGQEEEVDVSRELKPELKASISVPVFAVAPVCAALGHSEKLSRRVTTSSRRASHTLLSSLGGGASNTQMECGPPSFPLTRMPSKRAAGSDYSPLPWSSNGNDTCVADYVNIPITPCSLRGATSSGNHPDFMSPFTALVNNYDEPIISNSDNCRFAINRLHCASLGGAKRLSFSIDHDSPQCSDRQCSSNQSSPSQHHHILPVSQIMGRAILIPSFAPPSLEDLRQDTDKKWLWNHHQKPFYGNPSVHSFIGCHWNAAVKEIIHFPPFEFAHLSGANSLRLIPDILDVLLKGGMGQTITARKRFLVPSFCPPTIAQIKAECPSLSTSGVDEAMYTDISGATIVETNVAHTATALRRRRLVSQLMTPTQTQPVTGAGISMKVNNVREFEDESRRFDAPMLITMSLEVFCSSRKDLLPNPKVDTDGPRVVMYEVVAANYTAESESINRYCGCIVLSDKGLCSGDVNDRKKTTSATIRAVRSSLIPCAADLIHTAFTEHELFIVLIDLVRRIDPDFMIGYDVQNASWGWLISRASSLKPPINLVQQLGRVPGERTSSKNEHDIYGEEHESGIWICGRTIMNVWRRMREELKLSSYTIQSTAAHVLHKRLPEFTNQQMNSWYTDGMTKHHVFKHLYRLTSVSIDLFDNLDIIRRTAESARLYGIDFFSVLTRGSQYRVEAVMLRVAHKLGFIAMSPSKEQVARQAAMEVIPLVLEPASDFYTEPVVVLDFQSLYPSMICAYNLCFSTIMGKLAPGSHHQPNETTGRIGASGYNEAASIRATEVHLQSGAESFISPNGSMFIHPSVRRGILPLMLQEILDTRQMVKRSMKLYREEGDGVLRRVLDARQLALKMIANVTYGYTAAGFSGRMPMAELADAVVQCGRSALEASIRYIESHPSWDAKVVYGDTDSVFVLMKGRTKDEAFRLGRIIAQEITEINPKGVVLKFEKVYLPSILVSKKRYVGYSYEAEDQVEGHLDAKGIEIVRRDNCLATTKLQEKALRILFKTKDLTKVKEYLVDQWTKICIGLDKVPLNDFIFCKEVRLGHYALGPGGVAKSLPPGAIVAHKSILYDPMRKPPYRWRVPYVVCVGEPGARLKDLVVAPHDALESDGNTRINHTYYITKMILPSLRRLMVLAGVDVEQWYRDMPKPAPRLRRWHGGTHSIPGQMAITNYMHKDSCSICHVEYKRGGAASRHETARHICAPCIRRPQFALTALAQSLNGITDQAASLSKICTNCSQIKHHVIVPLPSSGSIGDMPATSGRTDPHLHINHYLWAGGMGCDSDGRGHRDIESCISLDCALFYERAKVRNRHKELAQLLVYADEAVKVD